MRYNLSSSFKYKKFNIYLCFFCFSGWPRQKLCKATQSSMQFRVSMVSKINRNIEDTSWKPGIFVWHSFLSKDAVVIMILYTMGSTSKYLFIAYRSLYIAELDFISAKETARTPPHISVLRINCTCFLQLTLLLWPNWQSLPLVNTHCTQS